MTDQVLKMKDIRLIDTLHTINNSHFNEENTVKFMVSMVQSGRAFTVEHFAKIGFQIERSDSEGSDLIDKAKANLDFRMVQALHTVGSQKMKDKIKGIDWFRQYGL